MNNVDQKLEERRKYVSAFNDTMVDIWKEKIVLLDAINRGVRYPSERGKWPQTLMDSVVAIPMSHDEKFLSVSFEFTYNSYGLFVNYGVGREVYRGNPGDIGRDKVRQPKKWMSPKLYGSMMRLSEFYAENVGADMAQTVSNALSRQLAYRYALNN